MTAWLPSCYSLRFKLQIFPAATMSEASAVTWRTRRPTTHSGYISFPLMPFGRYPTAMTTNSSKSEKFRKYREHLDRQIILLGDKYDLPKLSGADKQIAWATDIRIRFVESLDKNRNSLSEPVFCAVRSQILTQTESRWWIDRREQAYEDMLSFANTVSLVDSSGDVLPRYEKPSDVVFINAESELIVVSYFEPAAISAIMLRHSFTLTDGRWMRSIEMADVSRQGVIDALCLSLLAGGFTAKVANPPKPEPVRDGVLRIVDGRLCVEAKTEAVYKAASRLGKRLIWLDGVDKSEIQKFVSLYDIGITDDARVKLGGAHV